MSKTQSNEMPSALDRVSKAESRLSNAKRRLTRSEEQVRTARSEVVEAETEVKDSTAALEALIKRVLPQAMRRGGPSAAMALGEIISKLSGDDSGGQQLPLGEPGGARQPALADAGQAAGE